MAPDFESPLPFIPIIPADVLKKHHVEQPLDTRFRSAARLLQSLWREDQGLPIGSYVNEDGKTRKLGSRISDAAGLCGANFLTPEIARITRRQVAYREFGAMMDENRLRTNLLSSMPLTFNIFAPWVQEMERTTGYLSELLPGFSAFAKQVRFEHAPARGDLKFLGDYTAFDAFIPYVHFDGRRGFVAIEVKYSESMREPVPQMRERYDEASEGSGLYQDPAAPALRANPLQQLWREHMLAQCMIGDTMYDEGYFVCIAPALNPHVQQATAEYRKHLNPPEPGKVRFVDLTLEEVIAVIRQSAPGHADALHRRYTDFERVDGEMERHEPRPFERKATLPARGSDSSSPAPAADLARRVPQRRRHRVGRD